MEETLYIRTLYYSSIDERFSTQELRSDTRNDSTTEQEIPQFDSVTLII